MSSNFSKNSYRTQVAVAPQDQDTSAARYGMTEEQYKAYVADCEDSVAIYEDLYQFITTDPDAISYFA